MTHQVRAAAFADLDATTAYRLWALRESVFVVEQGCAYQELDGRDLDPATRHLWVDGERGPVGYLRILKDGDRQRIGRVLVHPGHRGSGIAEAMLLEALELIGAAETVLDAQSHLAHWYERFGFRRGGQDFVDDGIPHTPMRRPAPRR